MSSPLRADESVAGQEAFVAFLTRLTEDYRQRGEEWENPTLEQFLEALAAWVADAGPSWYERYQGETLPPGGNWTYFAQALMAATLYE